MFHLWKKNYTRSNRCFKKSNDFQSILSEIRLLFSNVVFVNSRKIIFVKRSSSYYGAAIHAIAINTGHA